MGEGRTRRCLERHAHTKELAFAVWQVANLGAYTQRQLAALQDLKQRCCFPRHLLPPEILFKTGDASLRTTLYCLWSQNFQDRLGAEFGLNQATKNKAQSSSRGTSPPPLLSSLQTRMKQPWEIG